jgi:hypothetical protein
LPQSPELHQHAGQDRSENDAETGPGGERQDLLPGAGNKIVRRLIMRGVNVRLVSVRRVSVSEP